MLSATDFHDTGFFRYRFLRRMWAGAALSDAFISSFSLMIAFHSLRFFSLLFSDYAVVFHFSSIHYFAIPLLMWKYRFLFWYFDFRQPVLFHVIFHAVRSYYEIVLLFSLSFLSSSFISFISHFSHYFFHYRALLSFLRGHVHIFFILPPDYFLSILLFSFHFHELHWLISRYFFVDYFHFISFFDISIIS